MAKKNPDKKKKITAPTTSSPSPITDRGVERKSDELDFKKIAVGVSGGIAAVEIVKITRELRRHGARVTAFFTPDATRFITELSVEWATGTKVIQETSAEVDHLETYDLVLVAPATLNTLVKCAVGMADNPVTLLVASQLGRGGKILMVPTMNHVLKNHPLYSTYIERLESWGVSFFEFEEEGRLKMPNPEAVAEEVRRNLS